MTYQKCQMQAFLAFLWHTNIQRSSRHSKAQLGFLFGTVTVWKYFYVERSYPMIEKRWQKLAYAFLPAAIRRIK